MTTATHRWNASSDLSEVESKTLMAVLFQPRDILFFRGSPHLKCFKLDGLGLSPQVVLKSFLVLAAGTALSVPIVPNHN